jgi:hypothetical protein
MKLKHTYSISLTTHFLNKATVPSIFDSSALAPHSLHRKNRMMTHYRKRTNGQTDLDLVGRDLRRTKSASSSV